MVVFILIIILYVERVLFSEKFAVGEFVFEVEFRLKKGTAQADKIAIDKGANDGSGFDADKVPETEKSKRKDHAYSAAADVINWDITYYRIISTTRNL